jgi:hypothetical protein
MCLHSWGGDMAIFPPHHLRAGALGHFTRPVFSHKEEGAFVWPPSRLRSGSCVELPVVV